VKKFAASEPKSSQIKVLHIGASVTIGMGRGYILNPHTKEKTQVVTTQV
jgi:hypothetical protein